MMTLTPQSDTLTLHPVTAVFAGGTTYTSDRGWGCMLRCIQMLYSHTLIRHNFSRDWRWTKCSTYNSILRDFLDDPNGLYSIQQIGSFDKM